MLFLLMNAGLSACIFLIRMICILYVGVHIVNMLMCVHVSVCVGF